MLANAQTTKLKTPNLKSGLTVNRLSTAGATNRISQQTDNLNDQEVNPMLYTIAVVLLILWLLGLVTSYTLGGFIHILLVVALVMVLVNVISGRRAL